jgi:hypothetical protein
MIVDKICCEGICCVFGSDINEAKGVRGDWGVLITPGRFSSAARFAAAAWALVLGAISNTWR